MDGWNCARSHYSLDESSSVCSSLLESFDSKMRVKMLRVNALLITSAILAGVIVGIGACCQRYRHHPFTRFIYLGASTLFLPIISSVFSLSAESSDYIMPSKSRGSSLIVKCNPTGHGIQVVIWAFLVQIIIINTSVVVATDDREGQNIGPPIELLLQGVWALYLGILYINSIPITGIDTNTRFRIFIIIATIFYAVMPFALTCTKIMFKYYAFQKARRSFELGRNPLLILGYMQQLQQEETNGHGDLQVDEDASPPPLLVTGEGRGHMVEVKPCGYVFKDGSGATTSAINNNTSLVTIDSVWTYGNSMSPTSMPPPQLLKDLCLSFALFKLLRCQFARYKLTNAGSNGTLRFFWSLLLKDGEHARIFGVITDELSFVNDYYYSSLPISYSKCWLPILSIIISVLSIGYFILIVLLMINIRKAETIPQLSCSIRCIQESKACILTSLRGFGNLKYFDMVPILQLIALVIITEGRDIASYICSNWTKVALICHTVNKASSQHFLHMPAKWVGLLLNCRCKLLNHWDGKMGQCSVLVTGPRTTLVVALSHLLRVPIPDRKRKVKVPEAVKVCIIDTLRRINDNEHRLSNGTSSLRRIQGGESFIWACNGGDTCGAILVWHIATCIFEVKDPYRRDQEQGSPPISYSHHKIAATHLSRYCVYLVTWCPELLPDDNDAWIKSLYKVVKKDAERALTGHGMARPSSSSTPEEEYQKLVELLSANSKHEVLKKGVKLGKQLVETIDGEETAWKLLAEFWSEMILYVAPSDNLKGHSEAIARGGELITLLWALLFHAGIVSRPGEEDSAAATSAGAV